MLTCCMQLRHLLTAGDHRRAALPTAAPARQADVSGRELPASFTGVCSSGRHGRARVLPPTETPSRGARHRGSAGPANWGPMNLATLGSSEASGAVHTASLCGQPYAGRLPPQAALLFIDVQNYNAHRSGAMYADVPAGQEVRQRTRRDMELCPALR
jgi:hypothetical protein